MTIDDRDPVTTAPMRKVGGSFRTGVHAEVRNLTTAEGGQEWAFFWNPEPGEIVMRRAAIGLVGLDFRLIPCGVNIIRDHNRNRNIAIPDNCSDRSQIKDGEPWEWSVIDENTLAIRPAAPAASER